MDLKEFLKSEGITEAAALALDQLKMVNAPLLARTLPQARSALIFLIPYYVGAPKGNLSLYARSLDYHLYAKDLSCRLCAFLKQHHPEHEFRVYADHSPISEVHAAALGGLGVIGKNGLLINQRHGSFVFIGELLSDMNCADFGFETAPMNIGSCIGCGKCQKACPCHFEDCASGIGQKKGTLTKEEERLVLQTGLVWGCDLCQTVCPMNQNAKKTPISFFYTDRIEHLDRKGLDALAKEDFEKRAFAWRGRAVVQRNLKIFEENASKLQETGDKTI